MDLVFLPQRSFFRAAGASFFSLFFHSKLSISMFSVLVLKVCRNRLSCHSPQYGRTIPVQALHFWPLRDSDNSEQL
jgi:hypothetical protein